MLLFGVILVVLAVSAIITSRHIGRANEQENIASSVAQAASELSYLSNDYLIYRETQQLTRWQSRFASFSSQVANLHVEKPEQQALVRNIRANEERMKQVFESVASAIGGPFPNQSAALDLAFFQVSWSRMAVQSQALFSDASHLARLLDRQVDQLTGIRTMLIYLMVGLFGLFLLASYMLTYSRILKSIATLQAGTAVIGAGDLDFKIEEKKNDEIGDLSRAFNRMTANLKDVTASKQELEREICQRKRAEEALREAHEKAVWLARFPDENPNPVLRVGTDGNVLYRNQATPRFTGWACEVGQRLPDELLALVRQALTRKAETQQDVDLSGRVYSVAVAPFPEERYANVYGRDITERKGAEEALRHAKEEWEQTFNTVPDLVAILDDQHRIVRVNRAMADRLGITSDQCVGLHCYEAVHSMREAPGFCPHALTCRDGEQHVSEVHEPRLGGYFLVSTTPLRNPQGQLLGAVHVARDITDRRRIEEDLRQSEEKSRLLIKYAPSMFYEIDFHGPTFKSVNDTMCQFLGYTREELLAMNPFDLLDNEGKALFRDRIRRKFAGEDISDSVEYKSKTKDGREVYGVLNISFTYRDGKPEGAVVVAHDITQRKRDEEALKQRSSELQRLAEALEQRVLERTEELEEANKTLRQLSIKLLSAHEEERKRVAGELHDTIGACLSGIKFKVESALDEIAKTPRAATGSLSAIVPVIHDAIEECRRIQMDLRPSMLDDLGLLPTLSWFFRRFQTIYSAIHVEQEMTISESELPDSLKIVIYRIIQEAMNNSAKHSNADLIRIALRKVRNRMELFVIDNGQGFGVQQRLFANNSKRGLGLTSMRERTELSGGSFAIESAEGKGTMIRASWPL